MGITLYPHNQETYAKVLEAFQSSNKTCIVQPTGTGKSFVFLKWIEDNPNDKILYLSPSNEIFNQLDKYTTKFQCQNILSNVETISYQKLVLVSEEDLSTMHADKIVIDEFHRTGADQWGKALQKLLEANPEAMVLGGTATPVRYLDEGKDMAKQLFDNNIARYMTLGEVVTNGILPIFTYVPVWYDYDDTLVKYQRSVQKYPNVIIPELENKLEELKRSLHNAYGAEYIFKKYMPTNHGKYIVFCSNDEHLKKMIEVVPNWLKKVNTNIHQYISTTHYQDRDEQLEAFKSDNAPTSIKLLFVIDRFNEGIHIDGIDGIIMLRPTISPIIYLQQLGRALASGAKQPIIFDMVNNFRNLSIIDGENIFEKEIKDSINNAKNKVHKDQSDESFAIFEQVHEFSELINNLNNIFSVMNDDLRKQHFDALNEYIQTKGKLPTAKTVYKGYYIGAWLKRQRILYKTGKLSHEYSEDLFNIGINLHADAYDYQWNKNCEILKEYIRNEGCHPSKETTYRGYNIGAWLGTQKKLYRQGKLSLEKERLLRDMGIRLDLSLQEINENRWNINFKVLEEYKQVHGYEPKQTTIYKGYKIGSWLHYQKSLYRKGKLSDKHEAELRSLGIDLDTTNQDILNKRWDLYLEVVQEYIAINHCVPKRETIYKGYKIGAWVDYQQTAYREGILSPEKKEKLEDIGINLCTLALSDKWMQMFEASKEYIHKEGQLPKANTIYKGFHIGRWLRNQTTYYRNNKLLPEREAKLRSIGIDFNNVYDNQWDTTVKILQEYVEDNHCLPRRRTTYKGCNIGRWLESQKIAYANGKLSQYREEKLRSIGINLCKGDT